MDNPQIEDDNEHIVRLTRGLNMRDLLSESGTTFEVNFDDLQTETEELAYKPSELFEYNNPNCCGITDEDVYQDGEPFEMIAKKMFNLLDDGSIKKQILRKGSGTVLPDKAVVSVHYNAYLEYNDEPFDSTYVRKKPFTFRLNNGETLPGLDFAVQSMKVNEKSQFLIQPKFAYGALGCLQRVPPNSIVLFEIEIVNCTDSGASVDYPNLPPEKQKDFNEVYKYALALCASANDFYNKNLYKLSMREYNFAVSKLETCILRDYADQEKQQQLLLRLLTNLVVTYTKLQEPRRACMAANKIYTMCKGTSLKVSAKVYFNHARSLMLLSEYDWAEKKLKQAQQLEPQNLEISKEFLKLDAKKKESYNREVILAKAIFKNTEINKEPHESNDVTKEFKESFVQYCKNLNDDVGSTQYNLPKGLTENELTYCNQEVKKYGLEFKHYKQADIIKYFISKPSTADN